MSKKLWLLIIGAVTLVLLIVGAVLGALYVVPQYRAGQHLARATEAAQNDRVNEAKTFFREYLYVNPRDNEVLETYAALCLSQMSNRRQNLIDGGRAYLKLSQLNPEDMELRKRLIDFYHQHGFWDDLESVTSRLLLESGRDFDLLYEKAVATQEQGRSSDAIKAFVDYLANPEAPRRDIPLRYARLLRAEERSGEALAMLETELAAHPDDLDVKASFANYAMDDGDMDRAAALLPASVDGSTADPTLIKTVIRLMNAKENFDSTLALTAAATQAHPDDAELHLAHVLALERLGKRDEIVAYLDALDPGLRIDAPAILLFQVEVLLAKPDWDAADEVRETYRTSYPNQVPTDEYLHGRIAFGREDFESAKERFTLAVEMNPNLDRARFYLGLTLLRLEDLPAARVALELYLRDNPDDRQARQVWSRYFDRDRSVLELRTAGRGLLESEDPLIDDIYMTAQDLLNSTDAQDKEMAGKLIEKALNMDSESPRAYIAMAGYYLELGKVDEAEAVLKRGTDGGIDPSSFALLSASISLARGEDVHALTIAKTALAEAPSDQYKTWATFFSRRGHLKAGQELLQARLGAIDVAERVDIAIFQVELALQFESAAAALEKLQAVEAINKEAGGDEGDLNPIRISVAQRLLGRSEAGDLERVAEILATVESIDPNFGGIPVLRGRMALRETPPDLVKAANILKSVSEESRYQDDVDLMMAEISLLQGQYDTTERLASKVSERTPNNKGAWHLAGDAQLRQGNLEGARLSLERVLEIDRSDPRAMRVLVHIYSEMRLRRKAETMFARYKDLISVQPGHEEELEELRNSLDMQSGNITEVTANLRQQFEENPEDYDVLSRFAGALASQGNYEEALTLVRGYLESHEPTTPEPWTFLGRLLLGQGDPRDLSEASSAFTQAQVYVPGYAPAQLGSIDVQSRLGNDGVAIALCDRFLENRLEKGGALTEQDAQVYFQRAALRSKARSGFEEAMKDLDHAIEIVDAPEFLSLRALIRRNLDDPQGAISDIRRIADLSGRLGLNDEVTIAEAYLDLGDMDSAARYTQDMAGRRDESPPNMVARIDAILTKLQEGDSN